MRARRADQERHAGEVADRRARRAGRRARCLGASRSARHGRVIICHGNIRKRAEVRAGELLREIAERKERHAGKACQGVARCYPYGSAQTLGPRGHQDALARQLPPSFIRNVSDLFRINAAIGGSRVNSGA
jgi:hypothetical protein